VVNHDVFKTKVLKNPRFVARMSDRFDRINNRKHAFFSVYHKCRYTFCLKEEIIGDVSFLINILLLSHQLWLESGSQPAEKLFASDFLKQSILFECFFVDVLTQLESQMGWQLRYEMFKSAKIGLKIKCKSLFDFQIDAVLDLVLLSKFVQIKQFFL